MLSNGCVAVDIGNRNIKMVHGNFKGQCVELYNFGIVPTPKDSISDGKIVNLNVISEEIKEFLKKHSIKTKKLILNVTGTGMITRDIKIPKASEKEIEKILEFESPQYFPVSLENYVLDYKILEEISDDKGNFLRILLVAVPTEQIDGYMNLSQTMKMDINAIDISANSVLKYVSGCTKGREEVKNGEFAIVDIGAETTGVCIFSKGSLMVNRVLLHGSKEIDKVISSLIDATYAESEELKKNEIDLNAEKWQGETEKLAESVRNVVITMAQDIRRFFEFYTSRVYGNNVKYVYLCGGGSKLRGIGDFLSGYINMPVNILSYQDKVVVKNRKLKEVFDSEFVYFVNAIGAIIR